MIPDELGEGSSFDLAQALGRIEAKVDILVEAKVDHTTRIGAIEKKLMYASGVAVAFMAAAGAKLGFHV